MSVLFWKSKKVARKATSPQLCETYAASAAVKEMSWFRCLLESMTYGDWDVESRARQNALRDTVTTPVLLRSQDPVRRDPWALLLSDSKGLYDSVASELPSDDKASAQEVPLIREVLAGIRGRCRWIPHNRNPADCLTKFR